MYYVLRVSTNFLLLLIVCNFVHRLIHNSCMFCVRQSFNKEAYLLSFCTLRWTNLTVFAIGAL